VCHELKPHPKHDRITIESIPDRLRILASIFFELREPLEEHGPEEMRDAVRSLYYQAESHADMAERFVERLSAAIKAKKSKSVRAIPDQIPLPFELTRPQIGAEIVSFSLFAQRRTTVH
jgi:hypothetical protein